MNSDEILGDRGLREIVESYGGTDVVGDRALQDIARSYGGTEVLFGEAPGGFDLNALISAGAEIAKGGVAYHKGKKASEAATKDFESKVQAAITADRKLVEAYVEYALAQVAKDAARIEAAQAVVEVARGEQAAAVMDLPPEGTKKRLAAANAASSEAARAWAAKPSMPDLAARAKATKEVAQQAAGYGLPVPGSQQQQQQAQALAVSSGPSFLSRLTEKKLGLPVWIWGVGVLGLGVGTYFLVQRSRRSQFAY